jgi:hypothetical protein
MPRASYFRVGEGPRWVFLTKTAKSQFVSRLQLVRMGRNQPPNQFHITAAQQLALDHLGNEHSQFLADPFFRSQRKIFDGPNSRKRR